jgi:hypothetical protein
VPSYKIFISFVKIRGDFILITGDTISNMSLTEALQAHKDRRKKDPDTVMTMFVKQSKPMPLTHQTRLGNDEIVMAIDPETKQLLYYEDRFDGSKRAVTLDQSLLVDNVSLYLRTDLEVTYSFSFLSKMLYRSIPLRVLIISRINLSICTSTKSERQYMLKGGIKSCKRGDNSVPIIIILVCPLLSSSSCTKKNIDIKGTQFYLTKIKSLFGAKLTV